MRGGRSLYSKVLSSGKLKVIVSVAVLVLVSSVIVHTLSRSNTPDWICQSTAYLVDDFNYRVGLTSGDSVQIDTLPDWLPDEETAVFIRARALPINAEDRMIRDLLPSPQVLQSGKEAAAYKWNISDRPGHRSQLRVFKYRGCISQIFLFMSSIPEKFDGNPVSVSQFNMVPRSVHLTGKPRESDCQLGGYTGQRIEYFVDGTIKWSAPDDIPAAIRDIFREFRAFDYGKDRVFQTYGHPEIKAGEMSWRIPWSGEGDISARVAVDRKCSKKLALTWAEDGVTTSLVMQNFYRH